MTTDFKKAALDYHEFPTPGKIGIALTKPADTAAQLALAYSPGVAEPVREIARDPENAYRFTGKGNLVAVITNGTAILGLGNLGPLASKPVMEGKALLFKRFAGIDSIDIEVNAESSQAFIDTVVRIADTFGGINLEDIKAPECFEIEEALIELCSIPVFHDDQHGTAIVTAAGMLNALEIQGKTLESARIVCLGAGAAATACMRLLLSLGAQKSNLYMVDRTGVIHSARKDLNPYKAQFVNDGGPLTLMEAMSGADVFACSNPDPEISYELAMATRDDLIMATGRSDYPNQVNNVLGFPFIFRGILDVRATRINEAMKIAAVEALRQLAKEPTPVEVLQAFNVDKLEFGRDYILPKALDARLLGAIAGAVAKAAIDTGVAKLHYPTHYPL